MKKEKANFEVPESFDDHPFFGMTLDDKQRKFINEMFDKDKLIVFCNARAGTGKTMLSVGAGYIMHEYGMYDRVIYIAAPTQEQKQGYLKGSLEEKSEPYFEPLYDAVEKLGIKMKSLVSDTNMMAQKDGSSFIECKVHTFLRGVNFENAFIIIDEAQNFYVDELKKVLTRIHDNCKVVVIGHTGQVDLYERPEHSGFSGYMKHFAETKDKRVAICELDKNYRGWISNTADDYEREVK